MSVSKSRTLNQDTTPIEYSSFGKKATPGQDTTSNTSDNQAVDVNKTHEIEKDDSTTKVNEIPEQMLEKLLSFEKYHKAHILCDLEIHKHINSLIRLYSHYVEYRFSVTKSTYFDHDFNQCFTLLLNQLNHRKQYLSHGVICAENNIRVLKHNLEYMTSGKYSNGKKKPGTSANEKKKTTVKSNVTKKKTKSNWEKKHPKSKEQIEKKQLRSSVIKKL